MQGTVSEGLLERALPDGSPCLHVSVGWFPFPLATCCPVLSARQSRLSGTNGPASPLLPQGISISNLGPLSSSVPRTLVFRAPACVSFRGRFRELSSQRESRALQRHPPAVVAGSESAVLVPALSIPTPSVPPRLGLGCKVQP